MAFGFMNKIPRTKKISTKKHNTHVQKQVVNINKDKKNNSSM